MILLDTNVLSELMKPVPEEDVVHWVDAQLVDTLYISAIMRAEIELGIALLPDGQRKQQIADAAQQMFAQFSGRCLVFGETAVAPGGPLLPGAAALLRLAAGVSEKWQVAGGK